MLRKYCGSLINVASPDCFHGHPGRRSPGRVQWYCQRRMVQATGHATNQRRSLMGRFRSGFGCRPTAVSTVRLVALIGAVMGRSAGNASPTADFPAWSTNRCSDFDLSGFTNAMNCGSPLSAPCFDFSRCRGGPTVYVYDKEVVLQAFRTSPSYIQLDPHRRSKGNILAALFRCSPKPTLTFMSRQSGASQSQREG